MGYDMHVVNGNGENVFEVEYPEVFDDAAWENSVRPQLLEREEGHYYWRRNMSGGAWQADVLVKLGMAYWPSAEPASWPGCDLENPCADGALCSTHRDHLSYVDSDRPGINAAKLCGSNDGWWVTKLECQAALAIWEASGRPDVDDGLEDTIPFLRRAAEHEGFRVW